MDFTGEQAVLGKGSRRSEADHIARYNYLQEFVKDKIVLDVACGSGYGSSLIGENAKEVYGVDISKEAIKHAEENFASSKVHFTQGNGAELAFKDKFFDVAVTFETIEHLTPEDTEKYLQDIHRTLKDDGILFLSTPNRRVVSPNSKISLVSDWHTHEYTERELVNLIEKFGFKVTKILGQRIIPKVANIGLVRMVADAIGKYILKRRVDLYWIPNPPNLVTYGFWQEPRCYFLIARKSK